MQSRWVGADGTRYLYCGYRFETTFAGRKSLTSSTATVVGRQTGGNYGGLYYTLHRHFDPVLMSWTSPDPAASPFYNLFGYCGNAPGAAYDPDGLSEVSEYWGNWLRQQGQDDIDEMRANGQYVHAGVNAGIRNFIAGGADILFGVIHGGYDFTNWATTGEEMSLTKMATGLSHRWEARQETISQSGASKPVQVAGFLVLSIGELIGTTQILVEGYAGVNSVTGQSMSVEERATAATEGGLAVLSFALGARRKPTEGGGPEGPQCFVAGTLVASQGQDGTITGKNIEQIEIGDQVWSRNEDTGEEGYKPVVRLFRNPADTLVHVTYTSGAGALAREETLTGTEEHPFWSLTRNTWVGMGKLQHGETLLLARGQTATATNVRTERLATPVTVYNFEVADWHTYHVGTLEAGWVWVHNLCARRAVDKLKALRREARTNGTELHGLVSRQRTSAVAEAWSAERALLKAGEPGTVEWSGFQKLQLRVFGKVRGYQGHHINSVAGSPYMASWKSNVTFMTRADHLAAHAGNWRTRTYGKLHEIYGGSLR